MKDYPTDRIRNLALIGHGGTGKTSFAEAALYISGASTRLGKVEDGTTASDFDPDEVKRKVSINASILPCEWDGYKINLIDTPGYADFLGDTYGALAATDTAAIVVCAVSGVQVGTELAWDLVTERSMPRVILVNRMDRENADFLTNLRQVQSTLSKRCVAVQLPIGAQESFQGVVDLVEMKAYVGDKSSEAPIPEELRAEVEALRAELLEAVAETDEDLLEKYLEEGDLSPEEARRGLKLGITTGDLTPVFAASSTLTIGVAQFLDAVEDYFPTPGDRVLTVEDGQKLVPDATAPLVAQVFKTTADPYVGKLTYLRVIAGTLTTDSHVLNATRGTDERIGHLFHVRGKNEEPVHHLVAGDIGAVAKLADTQTSDTLTAKESPLNLPPVKFPKPVFSVAVYPASKADTDKMSTALSRIVEEDPALNVRRDPDTGETILSGLGEAHVEVACEKMKRKFGAEIVRETPKVPYRETLLSATSSEYTHKKQSGGHGQYAKVTLQIEPAERGSGFVFQNKSVGGVVPRQYVPAVEAGVQEALHEGILTRNPVVDVRVSLVDGKQHPVDSSEMAFKLAGSQALKTGAVKAHPVLLEPVVNVRVRSPESYTGDLVADFNTKRARVLGITPEERATVIDAQAPMAEMQHYATDLRSLTHGRGSFEIAFDHYEEVPDHVAKKVIESTTKEVHA